MVPAGLQPFPKGGDILMPLLWSWTSQETFEIKHTALSFVLRECHMGPRPWGLVYVLRGLGHWA